MKFDGERVQAAWHGKKISDYVWSLEEIAGLAA
jgi:ATP-dependent DNA ligase